MPTRFRLPQRQVALLALLHAFGGRCPSGDFQKRLFLYCQESETDAPYEFVPYRYGAFSFTSYADRRHLVDRGLLVADERQWVLTELGRATLEPVSFDHGAKDFVERWGKLCGEALIAETYRRYPCYASRSEIAERVLRNDPLGSSQIDAERPSTGPPSLVTIGYEGRSLEAYLNLLLLDGVTLLCDVRRNPMSRKYGFSKRTLEKTCEAVGIRYEHLPQLGIASEERRGLNSQADYDSLFARYENQQLPQLGAVLKEIAHWMAAGERVALTCYERRPEQCHRHCIAEALEQATAKWPGTRHL